VPVRGRGNPESGILMLGEKPGQEELRLGKVWVGRAGVELDKLCWRAGIKLEEVWLDNIIQDAPTGDDWSVTDADIARNQAHITDLLSRGYHTVIAMGAVATRYLLGLDLADVDTDSEGGDVRADLGTVHGIMHHTDRFDVFPVFHPAASFHDGEVYPFVRSDFELAAAVIKSGWEGEDREDRIGDATHYTLITDSDRDLKYMEQVVFKEPGSHIFIDTEGADWCLTFSLKAGEGFMVRKHHREAIERLAYLVGVHGLIVVLHFAPHDIPVLRRMGWDLVRDGLEIEDTAIASYLLQIEPQGLKNLAYRHCGMFMKNYLDIVRPFSLDMRLDYLAQLATLDWGKPEPYIEEKKNSTKLHQPQGLNQRLNAVFNKLEKDGEKTDLYKWWKGLHQHVKGAAVEQYGDLPTADLDDVPFEQALWYACRDADATGRVYWRLVDRLLMPMADGQNLWETYKMDCSVIPHIEEMMTTGFKVDVEYFKALTKEWKGKQGIIRKQLADRIGYFINPESPPQVRKLLFEEMKLPVYKETDSGEASTVD